MNTTTPPHVHTIRVRYAECDAMGFLHHSRYFEYLEEARTEALRVQGVCYKELEEAGIFFVVAKLSCKYHRPIHYDDTVTVVTTIERFTRTRIDHLYELRCNDVITSHAETTLACVGKDGKPRVMPDRIWSLHQHTKPRRCQ